MVSTLTPVCEFGLPAPDFELPGVDGKLYRRSDVTGPNGLLVMFICNHCPYVKAILPRLVDDARTLMTEHEIGVVAIMSNDPNEYPEDSFDNMIEVARQYDFPFPYLLDATQQVAKAYDAVCTPDFFGYNEWMELQYRGRFDSTGRQQPVPADARHELLAAMQHIAATGAGPAEQTPSIGCSIKWKADA